VIFGDKINSFLRNIIYFSFAQMVGWAGPHIHLTKQIYIAQFGPFLNGYGLLLFLPVEN